MFLGCEVNAGHASLASGFDVGVAVTDVDGFLGPQAKFFEGEK